jgi:ABC-type dipeptide/oligopeptide/nickel transport system permease subunit
VTSWARRNPLAVAGAGVLFAVLVVAAAFPFTGYDPAIDALPSRASLPPGAAHWLGTDHNGRDVWSRLMLAAASFVWPGLGACVVAICVGVPLGAVAGYRGGLVEQASRYIFSVINALPRFVLVLLVASIYGDSLWMLAAVTGVAYAPALGEDVFNQIQRLRVADYVMASRAHGLPEWRILWIHLVWAACRRLIARHALTLFAYFAVLEATLSYLGHFGVQEPLPSWGNMLTHDWFQADVSWIAAMSPAIAIWTVVAAATVVRESIREVGRE